MATATGLTKARMEAVEAKYPKRGFVDASGHLLFETFGGENLDLGDVTGKDSLPTGSIIPFGGPNLPNGYLWCDGSEVSRSEYANLFAVIGTAYGSGNGTSTFRLPDLRGKVLAGRDEAQNEFTTLGQTGGSKTHTLTVEQIPPHNHPLRFKGELGANDNPHHNADDVKAVFGAESSTNNDNDGLQRTTNAAGTSRWSGIGTTNRGGGAPHNILQPYGVVNYVIKHVAGTSASDTELTLRLANIEASFVANGRFDIVERLAKNNIVDSGLITPTLTTGFTAGSSAERPTYRLKNGWVEVRGYVVRDSGTRVGVMFTLPEGYRPAISVWDQITSSGASISELKILPTGAVMWLNSLRSDTGAVFHCSFPAA